MEGIPPFYSHNVKEMYEKIQEDPLLFRSQHVGEDARSLITRLLLRDPEQRLGSSQRGALDIEEHPFYKDIDWKKLYNKEVEPPYQPKPLSDPYDTSNFHEMFTAEDARDSQCSGSVSAANKDMFDGFSYDVYQGGAL